MQHCVSYQHLLSWLSGLSSTESQSLRRKSAVDKLTQKAISWQEMGLHDDIAIRKLTDSQTIFTVATTAMHWSTGCQQSMALGKSQQSSAVNSFLVDDLTSWQPGFDFPRRQWSPLNRLRTAQVTAEPVVTENRSLCVQRCSNNVLSTTALGRGWTVVFFVYRQPMILPGSDCCICQQPTPRSYHRTSSPGAISCGPVNFQFNAGPRQMRMGPRWCARHCQRRPVSEWVSRV